MKNSSKKCNRILLLLACVAMIVGMCLAFSACKPEETAGNADPVLYWNVEGDDYRSGKFTRMAGEDGYVYMIFSKDGEQVRLPVQDITLANKIDMMKCMGLVLNADGVVVDAVRVEDFTGGFAVEEYVISQINGTQITTNSSGLLDGHEVVLDIPEDTPVWNVAGTGITVGIPWTLGVDDLVTVIKDTDGGIMCVYTEAYTEPADVYWNVNRMYDSTAKMSTRMSEAGGYRITLACNGEVKDYRTRDSSVVQQMDAMAAKCFGLTFDEEGYIIGVTHAGNATGGGSTASWYHCVGIDGQYAQFERLIGGNTGAKYTGMMGKNMKVFDVSNSDTMGQETELKVGDQVHCLLDSRSRLAVVFVVNRPVESEIYWNVDRKWDSKTAKTTRTPDADGWYNILVAVRGKQITVKTQDWEIANLIDGRAAKCFGLKLDENNVIEKFYTPDQARGSTFASWYDITALDGNNIELVKATTGDIKKGTLAPDCEIYDVSSTATVVGEVTELKVGDRVHTIKNLSGQINVAYVVTRYVDWPIYYNLDRKWNSTTNQTTRTPDADGYYVFRMAHDGEEVTVKTKSRTVANAIDKEVAKCLTLSVDQNGIVYKAMHASNATVCKGGASSSWTTVTAVSSTGFTTYKSETDKTEKEKYAWNAKVYNVSSNFIDHQGEETKLQVGDFVHCLTNRRGEITFVYIMTRYMDADVYYNLDRMWDDTTGTSTRTPDADGVYSIQMAYGGGEVTVKTTDPEVVNNIDKEVAMCVGLLFDENGYCTYATHAKNTDYCRGGIGMSYATVTAVEGDQVTVRKSGTLTTFTISENCEMFVTANIEDLTRGQYTTVRVGDFIHCLKEKSGKTNYMAIMSRVKQVPVVEHSCQHVTEAVTWYEWDGEAFLQAGYYVLTEDLELDSRVNIDAGTEITLCLNGHTVTNTDRFFSVYGTLNICDHKNAAGTYEGKLSSSFGGSGYGGIAYIYNSSDDGTVNVYGGTLEHTGKLTSGGLLYVGNTTTSGYTATLNIYDGTLTGAKTTGVGAGIEVSNRGVVNMYGGTLTGCTSDGNGGGMRIDSGTFNMTGGVIEGNKAGEGGNLSVGSSATVNISGEAIVRDGIATNGANVQVIGKFYLTDGAKLTGGTASGQGTAISAYANAASAHAIIHVENATIEGSVRLDTGKGPVEMTVIDSTVTGQIKVGTNNCTLTVGGKVTLNEVRLLDGKVIAIHENGLDDASSIAVTVDNTDNAFATITDANDEKCFVPADTSMYKLVNNNNDLYLELTVKPHTHCVCGGIGFIGEHTSCTAVEWTAWTSSDSLPTTSGAYYLTDDVTMTAEYKVPKGTDIKICLNGHDITNSQRMFSFRANAKLTLTDCKYGTAEAGTIHANKGGTSSWFYTRTGSVFDAYGITVVAKDSGSANYCIAAVAGDAADSVAKSTSTVNFHKVSISGGKTTADAPISVWHGSTLRLYGCSITDCAGKRIIDVKPGTLYMEDTTVTGNTIHDVGAVVLSATSKVTVAGKTVVKDNCKSDGTQANIYLADGAAITVGTLDDTASIGVTMAVNGVFASVTDTNDASCFFSDLTDLVVQLTSNELSLEEK